MRNRGYLFVLGSSLLMAALGCKGDSRAAPLAEPTPIANGGSGGSSGAGGSAPTTPDDAGAPDADAAAARDAAAHNCEDLTCRGAGRCIVEDGLARCECDEGYVLRDDECVVDETCIELRVLENGCRQRLGAEPAMAVFFGVETCAGTTVRPEILGDISRAFKVVEDGQSLGEESYAAVLARDVESYVALAVDLSGSLANDPGLLAPLIERLRVMVQSLTPEPGQPPLSMAVIAFGRSVNVAQPFTSDLTLVQETLDRIANDPASAVTEPGGTNLFGAVNAGVALIESALETRFEATLGAVVANGTLVSITDGKDTSGVTLEAVSPRINLISIGVSSNIDDIELTRVGREGSFLAPTPADWGPAFDRVAQRVSEYPDRSYLLGYCSPAVAGTHQLAVTLADRETKSNAECEFGADEFGVNVGVCNAEFISSYCAPSECRSFLACGVCERDGGAPTSQAPDDRWEFTSSN